MAARGLFVGLSTLDVIQLVERLPDRDEKIRGLDDMLAAGGPATNAAVAFAHLGGEAVLVTRAADGPIWELMHADLQACGVEVVRAPSQRTPTVASILVTRSTGERAVISSGDRGVSDQAPPPAELTVDVHSFDVVLIDGHEADLAAPLARQARAAGVPVVMDGGSWKPATPDLLPHVDAAVVSAAFRPPDTESLDGVFETLHGSPYRAVTQGGSGLVAESGDVRFEVAAEQVPVADTLGAGDFFHGTFAHHIAEVGLTAETFEPALAQGAKVAAESVQSFGTRAWLRRPTRR